MKPAVRRPVVRRAASAGTAALKARVADAEANKPKNRVWAGALDIWADVRAWLVKMSGTSGDAIASPSAASSIQITPWRVTRAVIAAESASEPTSRGWSAVRSAIDTCKTRRAIDSPTA